MNQEPECFLNRYLSLLTALLLFLFLNTACNDNSGVYPGEDWLERTPERMGIDPGILDSALNYLRANSGGAGTDEMMIIRSGYVVWNGHDIDNRHELFSCTKVFTTTVMGVMATDGVVGIDDPVVEYLPWLTQGSEGQEAYNLVRFRDLATMTAGYQAIVTDCWGLHLKGLHDESYECTKKYIIPGTPQYTPRTRISYRDPNVHILGYALTRIAGRPLEDIFRERVAEKIGMATFDWSDYGPVDGILFNNPAGTPNNLEADEMNEVQAGVWTTARDFGRLGLLYLNKGFWNGEMVLDSVFTQTAISNQVPAEIPAIGLDLAGRYGFYWWTNGVRKDGTRPWPSAPPKTSTPHGGGRNFCFVIPEWDMVIVRMSPRWESAIRGPSDNMWEGFFSILKDAVTVTR